MWSPPCSVKYKKVENNSLKSTQNYLVAHKAIDNASNILDLSKFRDIRDWLQEKASKKGYFPDFLIQDEKNGKKAIFNTSAFKKLDGINAQIEKKASQQPTLFQKQSQEGQIATEKTLRDLAARMSDRIGIPVRFISDRSQEFKGKIEKKNGRGNGVEDYAVINLVYATLDTPIHEILAHPIIRAIKNIPEEIELSQERIKGEIEITQKLVKKEITREQANELKKALPQHKYKKSAELYQNLLKELEYGKGKEVLDRIKRDYKYKKEVPNKYQTDFADFYIKDHKYYIYYPSEGHTEEINKDEFEKNIPDNKKYSLEEQQEEAIVELLGLMTAEKLDAVKDGKLISVLKRLLKEIKSFVKDLLKQREVEIDKLPDNMTLGDLSDLLAYSNSKLILPGYEVEYTTPDNIKFKTYQEASNHISKLAKSVEDVDLSNIKISLRKKVQLANEIPVNEFIDEFDNTSFIKKEGKWYNKAYNKIVQDDDIVTIWNSNLSDNYINKGGVEGFIEKNKEYEQSKEIIEEWKKVNNIQYNPEEIYSRGQEFSSVVGAYSNFDVNLMMQNLLSHIEDNEKAGGKFAISAYTKPIDKQIGHLEGGGGKIKFKIYPQSNDILWAANTDVYSGSVWDASEKVNKDKKSELLGVSYTKYPSLSNVNTVQPNLANIVDNLNHHHNELGIVLTGNNFRLEYDEDIPYTTKKIIDGINKILDQKYGKLVKPEIKTPKKLTIQEKEELQNLKDLQTEALKTALPDFLSFEDLFSKKDQDRINELQKTEGIQPTQTNETLKESINSVRNKLGLTKNPTQFKHDDFALNDIVTVEGKKGKYKLSNFNNSEGEIGIGITETFWDLDPVDNEFDPDTNPDGLHPLFNVPTGVMTLVKDKKQKEYTSQALINTKIAALKEVAKKYPRSLIRNEVKKIDDTPFDDSVDLFGLDDLPFQKLSEEEKFANKLFEEAMNTEQNQIDKKLRTC